jgi:hypothetical protein
LPQTLSTIKDRAFALESPGAGQGLGEIALPASIRDIGAYVFAGQTELAAISFLGDARSARLAEGAFYLNNGRNYGALRKVIFFCKKAPDINAYISSGMPAYQMNEYRRSWHVYYHVDFYSSKSAFARGNAFATVEIREDMPLEGNVTIPATFMGGAWSCEPGFSFTSRTTDSYYAKMGRDISVAQASSIESKYAYTGGYVCPRVTLCMPDGSVLSEGVDYVYNPTIGILRDGYANNRRGPKAAIYLLGIGNYAGNKMVESFHCGHHGKRGCDDGAHRRQHEFYLRRYSEDTRGRSAHNRLRRYGAGHRGFGLHYLLRRQHRRQCQTGGSSRPRARKWPGHLFRHRYSNL